MAERMGKKIGKERDIEYKLCSALAEKEKKEDKEMEKKAKK